MEESTTQKGKRMLFYEGYRFKFAKRNVDDSVSWRCLQSHCCGRIKIMDDFITVITEHNHTPEPGKIEALKAAIEMRERAEQDFCKPRQIIQNSTAGIALEAAVHLPSYSASQRNIERKRKITREPLQNPGTVRDIVIPQALQTTLRGMPFMLWDSGAVDPNRILMFGSKENLDSLKTHQHWFIDGTFKVAPKLFFQVFTIHSLVEHKALPMVYALMTDKTEASYNRLFDGLKNLQPALNPKSIMSDFEKASQNAVGQAFPAAEIVGCLFHLGQNLWRKVQQLNLANAYKNDENFRTHVKMLLALSFVPPADVAAVFDELVQQCPPEMADLIDYWEDNYIGRMRLNTRVNPRFPIPLWNVHARVTNGLPRTNNSVEGWHHAFQQCVDCHHPSIIKLVEHFRKEQDHVEIQMERFKGGVRQPTASKSKYVQLSRRLEAIIPAYGLIMNVEYLRRISHNLSM